MPVGHVLLVLLCAQAAWAAIDNDAPVTAGPRTFLRKKQVARVEETPQEEDMELIPMPEDDYTDDDVVSPNNASQYDPPRTLNNTSIGTRRAFIEWRLLPAANGSTTTKPQEVEEVEEVMSDEAARFLNSPLSTLLMPCFYALVCLVSVPLNGVALVAFSRKVRPVKPAVVYMLNLATADLLLAAVLPFRIVYHFNGNDWPFGPAMCRVVTAAFYCNMYCSVLLITCISVDRLLAVVYPIDSLVWRKPQNAVAACVLMWMLAVGGSVPLVFREQTMHIKELGITTCHDVQYDEGDLTKFYMIYFCVLSGCLFFLPLVVTAVCYTRVIWTLSSIPRGVTGRSRRKARAVVMALTVLCLFVLCFTPSNVLLLVHYLQMAGSAYAPPDGSYALYLVFLCVGSASCCLDPLVYYFGSSQCQRQLGAALGCRAYSDSDSKSGSHSYESRSTSSRTIFKSSLKSSAKKDKSNSSSTAEGLKSQYKKLLV